MGFASAPLLMGSQTLQSGRESKQQRKWAEMLGVVQACLFRLPEVHLVSLCAQGHSAGRNQAKMGTQIDLTACLFYLLRKWDFL